MNRCGENACAYFLRKDWVPVGDAALLGTGHTENIGRRSDRRNETNAAPQHPRVHH